MGDRAIEDAVELGDLDELVRLVERLCAAEDWAGLVELRDRSRAAVQRGKQLWPAASHAEYRLALEAPGGWAGAVLAEGAGRFALGPLPEVAASTHEWAELAPHVPPGPPAEMAAHERVIRGEDLEGDGRVTPVVLDLPLRLQPWEPAYPLAVYRPDKAQFPPPDLPATTAVDLPPVDAKPVEDVTATHALLDLVDRWVIESNGRSRAVAVEGDMAAALSALDPGAVRVTEIEASTGLAWMAWAAANGGAHGRRRGMATGRFGAWWATAAIAGLADEWPVMPAKLGDAARHLRWWFWHPDTPLVGWHLHLAVEDPQAGRAWAVTAVDTA